MRISTQLNSTDSSPSVINLVEGLPSTLRCMAVGGYPRPRLQLLVDDRVEPASAATTMSTASAAVLQEGGGHGLRVVTVTSWRWTANYRARPSDDGAHLKCLATVPGLPAVAHTVKLSVDCQYTKFCRSIYLFSIYFAVLLVGNSDGNCCQVNILLLWC